MNIRRSLICAIAALVICATAHAATSLAYTDLVKRLTDLEQLSVLPVPGETCAQWSSYDRTSSYDPTTGKYTNWDANHDDRGIIRTEGDLEVLAEIDGPGCIWRIWSAAPREGRVMIYLDGAKDPVVNMPFADYFSGKNRPFNYPALVNYVAMGANCYVPIPFQKSCKVLAEKNWGGYYHFTYSTFPKDTIVPTFSRSLSGDDLAALAEADKILTTGLGSDPAGTRKGEKTKTTRLSVPAGDSIVAAQIGGPRAITAIRVKLDPDWAENEWKGLREVAIRITWDGDSEPSVWCPLGDFFGTAPGSNLYKSLPLGVTEDGSYSYWYMPFAKSARIELVNDGGSACPIEFSVTHAPLTKPIGELARFHAKWHRDMFLPTEPERAIEWTMLKTTGRGRFCGVILHVFNPKGGWWGEGDEMFYVDGEKFPSTLGTGSEDYFGYAWCCPDLFYNAYHNQTINQGNNFGNVSVNRWHIADNVPFQKSFEGTIEKYYPNSKPTLYAAVPYWYQAAGETDPYTNVPVADRTGYYDFEIPHVEGAIEGERMKILNCSDGRTSKQDMVSSANEWSGLCQLWWQNGKPGAKLVLGFSIKDAGSYDLKAQFTKAKDYGIVQLYLDDKKLGGPMDFYAEQVTPTGELPLGTFTLAAGKHKLTAEITGANEKAAKKFMFGLDYIKLDRK